MWKIPCSLLNGSFATVIRRDLFCADAVFFQTASGEVKWLHSQLMIRGLRRTDEVVWGAIRINGFGSSGEGNGVSFPWTKAPLGIGADDKSTVQAAWKKFWMCDVGSLQFSFLKCLCSLDLSAVTIGRASTSEHLHLNESIPRIYDLEWSSLSPFHSLASV